MPGGISHEATFDTEANSGQLKSTVTLERIAEINPHWYGDRGEKWLKLKKGEHARVLMTFVEMNADAWRVRTPFEKLSEAVYYFLEAVDRLGLSLADAEFNQRLDEMRQLTGQASDEEQDQKAQAVMEEIQRAGIAARDVVTK